MHVQPEKEAKQIKMYIRNKNASRTWPTIHNSHNRLVRERLFVKLSTMIMRIISKSFEVSARKVTRRSRFCCCLKNSFQNAFFKESTESLCLTGKDKLFHTLQVVTVKVPPPSVSRLYLGEVRLKLQYLVCLLWMLLFNLSRSFR